MEDEIKLGERIGIIKSDESKDPVTELDVLVGLAEVKSRIGKEITRDFTMAFLNPEDKEGVINAIENAHLWKGLLTKLEESKTWKWNKKIKKWEHKKIENEEIEKMQTNRKELFDIMLNKVITTVLMNRNRQDNHLVNLMAGKTLKEAVEDKGWMELLKENMKIGEKK